MRAAGARRGSPVLQGPVETALSGFGALLDLSLQQRIVGDRVSVGGRVISRRDPEWATETLPEEESEDQNVVYTYAHAFLWEGSSCHPVTALLSPVPRSLCSKCLRAGWLDEGREVGNMCSSY